MKNRSVTALVAAVAALVGLVIYLITSFTGYLANAAVNIWPIVCSVVAVALLAAVGLRGGSWGGFLRDVLVLLAGGLLIVSFALFVLGRVTLAADVYFIPVNYPAAEGTALYISMVGLAAYLVGIVAVIAAAFRKDA